MNGGGHLDTRVDEHCSLSLSPCTQVLPTETPQAANQGYKPETGKLPRDVANSCKEGPKAQSFSVIKVKDLGTFRLVLLISYKLFCLNSCLSIHGAVFCQHKHAVICWVHPSSQEEENNHLA